MSMVCDPDFTWHDGICQPVPWNHPALPGTLSLYCVPFDAECFDTDSFQRSGIICPPDIAKAVHKRQAEYFYGRLCARAALQAHGCPGDVGTGPMRAPTWAGGMVGSITHGRRLAAAVALPAGSCQGIGIDFEDVATPQACDALRSSVVSPQEVALLEQFSIHLHPDVLLTLIFSAKESFFKATSAAVGRYFGFDAIVLRDIDLQRHALLFDVAIPLCASWQPGAPVRVAYRQPFAGGVATLFAW